MSSPNLNYLIIAGSLLMYFSVYVQLLYSTNETANHVRCIVRAANYVYQSDLVDSESTVVCNYNILLSWKSGTFSSLNMTFSMQLHTWIYVLGYLLAFGTILAKMWRVYQIFHNPTPNKMVLHYSMCVLYGLTICMPCGYLQWWI